MRSLTCVLVMIMGLLNNVLAQTDKEECAGELDHIKDIHDAVRNSPYQDVHFVFANSGSVILVRLHDERPEVFQTDPGVLRQEKTVSDPLVLNVTRWGRIRASGGTGWEFKTTLGFPDDPNLEGTVQYRIKILPTRESFGKTPRTYRMTLGVKRADELIEYPIVPPFNPLP